MIDIPIDFETYRDKDYQLSKLTTAEYVLDPRFEIIGVALRTPDGVDHWVSGDVNHVRSELLRLVPDWSAVRVVAHNARFEAAILEWRLNIKPGAYFCTMVGSRPHILPITRSVSLAAISAHLGLTPKGDYVKQALGKHRADFTPAELTDYGNYSKNDQKNSMGISTYLFGILPGDELEILDLTIKKFARPKLRLDRGALVARLMQIETAKAALASLLETRYKATLKDIRSRPKFAAILAQFGVQAPMKPNKKGTGMTFAFAKDDLAFKELLAHEKPEVRELVAAKNAMSSTLEESRVKRLITLHDIKDGWLPIPLVYYGAHPGRLSGDDEINMQNLPRVEIKNGVQKGHLRYAIVAPDGYSIVAADFSNIEARIVATLADALPLREGFRRGEDIYSGFASTIYGRLITKQNDPLERFVGKTCILGLGYGMGWRKFQLKMRQEGIEMTDEMAQLIVSLYRQTYPGIPQLWRELEFLARTHMLKKDSMFETDYTGLIFAHQRIILPNGMPLMYPGLRHDGEGFKFDSRFAGVDVPNNIWGGTFLENISQALARIIAVRAELRLARRGLPAAHQNHDELIWVIPTAIVEKVKVAIALSMCEAVDFMPELPIAVEIKHGPTYGDAK